MATITNPANACEICQDSMVGSRASTNQSDTKAVVMPVATKTETARPRDQGFSSNSAAGTLSPTGPPLSEKGILAKNTASNTSALAMLNVSSWASAGV